jgi:hypothetical protein
VSAGAAAFNRPSCSPEGVAAQYDKINLFT